MILVSFISLILMAVSLMVAGKSNTDTVLFGGLGAGIVLYIIATVTYLAGV